MNMFWLYNRHVFFPFFASLFEENCTLLFADEGVPPRQCYLKKLMRMSETDRNEYFTHAGIGCIFKESRNVLLSVVYCKKKKKNIISLLKYFSILIFYPFDDFLLQFCTLLIAIFVLEIIGGTMGYVMRAKVETIAREKMLDTMKKYNDSLEIKNVWDNLQRTVMRIMIRRLPLISSSGNNFEAIL